MVDIDGLKSLTTSQFVTAPKLYDIYEDEEYGLTTSQFVTAPKLHPLPLDAQQV